MRKFIIFSFLFIWIMKKKKLFLKVLDLKVLGREGEEGVIFVLLRFVYVIYRFILGMIY